MEVRIAEMLLVRDIATESVFRELTNPVATL